MLSGNKGVFLIALSASLFATEAIFVKLGYAVGVNIITTLLFRFLPAALVLLFVAVVTGQSLLLPKKSLGIIALISCCYIITSVLLFKAFALLPASMAILFFYAYPALTGIIAYLVNREKLSRIKSLALMMSACGLVLLLWSSITELDMFGVFLCLGAALSNAFYLIILQKVLTKIHQISFITWIFGISTIFFTLYGLFSGTLDFSFSFSGWFYLACLSFVSTAAATLALMYGLPQVGPTLTAIVGTLEPPVTALLAFIVFGETLQGWQIIGAFLVLVAVLLPQIKIKSVHKEKYI